MRRRVFLERAAGGGAAVATGLPAVCRRLSAFGGAAADLSRVEARWYRKLADREIECELCPRRCRLGDKERGYCGVRENQDGTYYSLVYGKVCSANVDPIEKKPFFHVLPGRVAFSVATAGCNVNCKFCQNWEISQVRAEQVRTVDLSPAATVEAAVRNGCPAIAYTYSEPVVFYEYMIDTAREARRRGVRSLVVTGGHILADPLKELLTTVDAVKVDLKGFDERFYKEYVRGELKTVLETIATVAASKIWMEIVYLVVPTLNDDPDRIRAMARWLKGAAGPDVPLHFSRFTPMYLVKNLPPTPVATLEAAWAAAREEGLRYVYIGNVPGHEAENTVCPTCGKTVLARTGFAVRSNEIERGRCRFCRSVIPGVWA